jgi:pimeloyl-ACP methyl ester carboxylesterase
MTTFVLVHGAWHGAWVWAAVGGILRGAGHAVVTPALAGALDGPSATRETGLRTHSDAVATVLRDQPGPVTLVGHSYAGLVVRQAAATVPGRVDELVLLDGWAGPVGTSLYDLAPPSFAAYCDAAAAGHGDGWLVPAPPPAMFGITDATQGAWLQERLRPHPRATFTEPSALVASAAEIPGRAIVTTVAATMPFTALASAAGYPVATLAAVHDALVTAPRAVAEALLTG